MLEQVQSTKPADFAIIALEAGEAWLTSRLYIAAVMMERMRGTQVFVFVERTASTERRLLAVASVRQLRWALARRYPWLEAAFVRASLFAFPLGTPLGSTSATGWDMASRSAYANPATDSFHFRHRWHGTSPSAPDRKQFHRITPANDPSGAGEQ